VVIYTPNQSTQIRFDQSKPFSECIVDMKIVDNSHGT
jgi:hypothetical protein